VAEVEGQAVAITSTPKTEEEIEATASTIRIGTGNNLADFEEEVAEAEVVIEAATVLTEEKEVTATRSLEVKAMIEAAVATGAATTKEASAEAGVVAIAMAGAEVISQRKEPSLLFQFQPPLRRQKCKKLVFIQTNSA
jgi:hypothetical protein